MRYMINHIGKFVGPFDTNELALEYMKIFDISGVVVELLPTLDVDGEKEVTSEDDISAIIDDEVKKARADFVNISMDDACQALHNEMVERNFHVSGITRAKVRNFVRKFMECSNEDMQFDEDGLVRNAVEYTLGKYGKR